MVLKVIVIILLLWLFCTLCFTLGLFFASAKLGRQCEEPKENKCSYKVTVRYGQTKGFVKSITLYANDEYDAISKALKIPFKYEGISHQVISIVSVDKINNLEENYYA
jgi:hypothetical protein